MAVPVLGLYEAEEVVEAARLVRRVDSVRRGLVVDAKRLGIVGVDARAI